MPEIIRYTPDRATEWNQFVSRSKNATFLFDRGYMDYHADRFCDHSLMVYHKGRLYAVLPANADTDTLWSHQGLTYGGLLTGPEATTGHVCDIFIALNDYLRRQGFRRVVYKTTPWIYHLMPAEEDLYALVNVCGAKIITRHISSTIERGHLLAFTEARRSGIRKAKASSLQVAEPGIEGISLFWPILNDNLASKYGATPVHTQVEMRLLMSRFPEHIRLFTVDDGNQTVAGTVIYVTPEVTHTQYISASHRGKQTGALDLLFDYLLKEVFSHSHFFDFGKSSDGDGHDLNRNLIFQKEGFGGRGICYDWYEYQLEE